MLKYDTKFLSQERIDPMIFYELLTPTHPLVHSFLSLYCLSRHLYVMSKQCA